MTNGNTSKVSWVTFCADHLIYDNPYCIGLSICAPGGNRCVSSLLRSYRDDLSDRAECDCRDDCEMVHFFATGFREAYETQQACLNLTKKMELF